MLELIVISTLVIVVFLSLMMGIALYWDFRDSRKERNKEGKHRARGKHADIRHG